MNTRARIAALFAERGDEFSKADKAALDAILIREPSLDLAHQEERDAMEALFVIVADPLYAGDLVVDDLGDPATAQEAADELMDRLLG